MAEGVPYSQAQLLWYQGHKERWIAHLLRTGVTEIVLDGEAFARAIAAGDQRCYRVRLTEDTFLWDGRILVRNADSLPTSDPCWGNGYLVLQEWRTHGLRPFRPEPEGELSLFD